jgi:hypothetical protein
MNEDTGVGLLDLDRNVAAHQMVEDLPGPIDRRLPAAVNGPLGPDLDLGMDELAHRRPVARAEGGQEAASELFRILDLSTAQVLGEAARLVAETRLACEAEPQCDHAESK